ncbi:thiamine ABC transporter ATP-binding protein [Celerinatantimonas sp. YJH-8]|uniref:thiamine ABC transporter ATP-binding protein n=1 Tax=Celerinatantimonas sp. YJH-8 TaxID=3228714 RepID=UPI0038C1BDBA
MLDVKALIARRGEHEFCYDFSCHAGQIVAVLGQSGCGKSTLLAMIAGFIKAQGQLSWQGQSLQGLPVAQRPVSSLFQQHNLFEHLNVMQNLALALHRSLRLNDEQRQKIKEVAERLDIVDLMAKFPGDLSGGQRQRAALARALLRERPILLLDEPFSALDPILRDESLRLVSELCREHHLAVLLVTHQWQDAMAIADEVAFIDEGRVVQQCSPEQLLKFPASSQIQHYLKVSS